MTAQSPLSDLLDQHRMSSTHLKLIFTNTDLSSYVVVPGHCRKSTHQATSLKYSSSETYLYSKLGVSMALGFSSPSYFRQNLGFMSSRSTCPSLHFQPMTLNWKYWIFRIVSPYSALQIAKADSSLELLINIMKISILQISSLCYEVDSVRNNDGSKPMYSVYGISKNIKEKIF